MRLSRDGGSNFIGGGVSVASRSGVIFYANADVNTARPQSCVILDSPSSTSALTYKLQFRLISGSVFYVPVNNQDPSLITAYEIAG